MTEAMAVALLREQRKKVRNNAMGVVSATNVS